MSPDQGCLLYSSFPKAVTCERAEHCGERAGDAQFHGNRQRVSGQLTPAANRAAAAAGMSCSAKTRFQSKSTAQASGVDAGDDGEPVAHRSHSSVRDLAAHHAAATPYRTAAMRASPCARSDYGA
jgi:hypothetical protein